MATPDTVNARINLQSKQIFSGRYKKYFTAINSLESNVTYEIKSGKFQATTDANVSSKYASSLILKDTLTYDTNLSYGGSIDITGVGYFPELMLPLFKDAKLHYQGDSKDLVANLQTDKLHLLYKMYDFERADFHLTSKDLNYTDYDPTPSKILTPLVASLSATMSLDFDKTDTLLLDTNITSNAVNIVGKTTIYDGKASTKSTTTLSENSYLKELHKDVKYTDIFPAALDIGYHDSRISLDLVGKNPLLKNSFLYDLNSSYLKESLTLGSDTFTLEGDNTRLNFSTHTYSLKTLQESLMPFYTFNKEPYDGEVEINATIENFSIIDADIKSKWLVYEYSLNKFAFVEKLKMQVHSDTNKTILKNYRFNTYIDYDRQFYATKPSTILYQDNKLTITTLWINDALHTKGGYDITKHQGIFYTTAQKYRYNGQEGDITFNTNIKTTFDNKKTHIEGNIDILKGLIRYEHRNKHDIQDPDIIIIQEEAAQRLREQEKKSDLSLDISITAKQPLTYKVPQIEASITPDIKIWKVPQKNLELLGRAVINKGTYMQRDKEFVIRNSEVLFGGDLYNPYLNIKAQHTHNPYVIDIDISGTLDAPIINFSSNPYLSQSDILSMLLFSSTTDSLFEGSSNSSNQAISMLGNTFAKEIVKNFGLTLDRLVLSTNDQGRLGIEIGKKISKKITIIYTNDIVQSVKVKYQHSDSFETDFMLSPESTGIDFIYKSEH